VSNALAIASVTAVLKDVLSNGMKAMKVGDICTRKVICARAPMSIREAAESMRTTP
jgi:predicted transcriptional regulator